ncbi:F510_1955 family glycosylhydrolase [Metabacillus endolithicus]|uniref:F510_1955 family glycosylhydrolase n=1 Tax=Metabacillus endolithicus TaxID=1535204 RepID=A0ABW5C4Z6_9BACI|nr:hypothetical protein [Metabacillus endolithicus]UPG62213.1 hypothetical protein MVE64_16990 [Metabacillus endolithicus]
MIKKLFSLFLLCNLLTACSLGANEKTKDNDTEILTDEKDDNEVIYKEIKDEKIDHIHGIGYVGNEDKLYLASHDGLLRFSNEKWSKITENKHDYMGFQATDIGFYSSGHPENGSELKNPLGIIKSTDEGKTLNKLAFYGETDFHYLAAGYNSHIIYVINESKNSRLNSGFYYSEDEGENWAQSKTQGLSFYNIGNIATHPAKANIVAISTDQGLFISNDYGDSFSLSSQSQPVTSVEFREKSLLYFTLKGDKVSLYKQELSDLKEEAIPLPKEVNGQNPVMYISSHPEKEEVITVVTYESDIYQTKDHGQSWTTLVSKGKIQS